MRFVDTLLPTSFDARSVKIWSLKDEPGTLVRERILQQGEDENELKETQREAQELFGHMGKDYGIRSVSMGSNIDEDKDGKRALFTLVDRIEGENLFDAKHLPVEAKDELDSLYVSFAKYYHDSWKNDRKFWADCKSSQFVYGHKHGETENHPYIVDIDPHFLRKGEDPYFSIEWCLDSISHDLVDNEAKFEPKARFETARREVLRVLEDVLSVTPNSKPLLESRELLLKT